MRSKKINWPLHPALNSFFLPNPPFFSLFAALPVYFITNIITISILVIESQMFLIHKMALREA